MHFLRLVLLFFFFFSTWTVTSHEFTVHDKNTIHALFTDLTILFTHLKIILLQCFQFSVSTKISCIQMDPKTLLIYVLYHLHRFGIRALAWILLYIAPQNPLKLFFLSPLKKIQIKFIKLFPSPSWPPLSKNSQGKPCN